MTSINDIKNFWESNPVAAAAIDAEIGSEEYFLKFDQLREADNCEPYEFSNKIHGYEKSKGLKVLDVGCGNGYVLSKYAQHGAQVYGVDLTEKAIYLSKKRFENSNLQGYFSETDGMTLEFKDNYFDIVCSMGVLHHVHDPKPMLNEMIRVLKPGGEMILMLYNRYSFKYQVLFRLYRHIFPIYKGKSLEQITNMNDGEECPLAKVYSKSQVDKLLYRMENVTYKTNQLSWEQLFIVPSIGRRLSKYLPDSSESVFARHWGWNLYVNARKP